MSHRPHLGDGDGSGSVTAPLTILYHTPVYVVNYLLFAKFSAINFYIMDTYTALEEREVLEYGKDR